MPSLPAIRSGIARAGMMRVLVVEDETRLRELLADVIPDMGYPTSTARTAEEARRLMVDDPHEIVMLDLQLPMRDGMSLFEEIRRDWPATQVIVLTGHGDLEAARRAIRLDVVDFLAKPCPLRDVELSLDRARRRAGYTLPELLDASPAVTAPMLESTRTLADSERELILAALARNQGNRTATAAELGISRRTLHYRIVEYQAQGRPLE